MKPKKLYIIGNGFDLAHNFKTKYSDFRKYLHNGNGEDFFLYQGLSEYYEEDLWSDFENILGTVDSNFIYEEEKDDYIDLIDLKMRDCYALIDTVEFKLDAEKLKNKFKDWITSINIIGERIFNFEDNSAFLTFNYTNTLEKIYGIPNCKHIHGDISNPIFGHRKGVCEKMRNEESFGASEISRHIEGFYNETTKDVMKIIQSNMSFFNSLSDVNEVVIYGHSLNSIDSPYYDIIRENIKNDAIWKRYYEQGKNELKLDIKISDSKTTEDVLFDSQMLTI